MKPSSYREVIQFYADEFRCGPAYRNWRPEGVNDWLFIYTVGGRGLFRSRNGREYHSQKGDCMLYEPKAWQRYDTDPKPGRWRLLWARIHPFSHWLPRMAWPVLWPGLRFVTLLNPAARRVIERGMRRAIKACRSARPLAADLGLNAMEEVLLQIQAATLDDAQSRLDGRILKAVNLLTSRFREPFSVTTLASECGLSVSHLGHLFKSETRTTPQRMLEENRMRNASQLLLSTALGVSEIAREVGYENPFYFTNRFRKFWKQSPTAFRARRTLHPGRTFSEPSDIPWSSY